MQFDNQRDKWIGSLFSSTLEPIHRLSSPLGLNEEEAQSFDEDLYGWFWRFSRRPGYEHLSGKSMRGALLAGAVRLTCDVATLKNCPLPFLTRDPSEIARQLGIDLDDPAEPGQ